VTAGGEVRGEEKVSDTFSSAEPRRADLLLAAGLAVAAHAALFASIPAVLVTSARAGQRPGAVALEIALSEPAAPVEEMVVPMPRMDLAEPVESLREPELAAPPLKPPDLPDLAVPAARPRPRTPASGVPGARAAAVADCHILYPRPAQREGRQGAVTLRVEVTGAGRAGRVAVVESSGHADLDAAAVEGLRRARYLPATDGRRPVASTHLVKVRFELSADGRARVR